MLLVQALLPSFIYAAAPRDSALAEVCTAFGIKKIALKDREASDSAVQRLHCPVCTLADALALPASPGAQQAPVIASFSAPIVATPQHSPGVQLSIFLRGPPAHA